MENARFFFPVIMYSDDFTARGKTSISGVYPMYPSMNTAVRSRSQDVRVTAALPTYASSDAAVSGAMNDLELLSSKGRRLQITRHGRVHMRARLDLSRADSVQTAKSSDTSGLTSISQFTVCAARRASLQRLAAVALCTAAFVSTRTSVYRG